MGITGGSDAEESPDTLPDFLRPPVCPPYVTYGELSYNKRSRSWVIRGEPAVCQMAKRLFPGCDGRGRGTARFTAHRRIVGDLHWLMLRWPLDIRAADRARWEEALADARAHAIARREAEIHPLTAEPRSAEFEGTLMPFQKLGAGFLIQNRRALLADEMGLGKTVQALAALSVERDFPALIVCPSHLVGNWDREIKRFVRVNGEAPRVNILRGLTPYEIPQADITIIHYLLLRGWKSALPAAAWRTVVFDEIQELRHGGTEKYSAASLLGEAVQKIYGLSGTPIYNLGGEIYNVVNILDFHALGDYDSFSREWCVGYGGDILQKPELLGQHLRREGLLLRRTKDQVLDELPPKRRAIQPIDADDQVYRALIEDAQPLFPKLDSAQNASERARLLEEIGERERQATGLAKAPHVATFVRALLEAGEKVLLFAHHHAVMDAYKRELKAYKPGFITGRETTAQKEDAVARFMDARCDLLCVSLRAASGLNLQRASCVVFGELDWSPAVHAQAEDRAHRIGQKDSVLCYYLVAPRGSDADMMDAIGLKVSQFVSLMGDRPLTEEETERQAAYAREAMLERIAARVRGVV